MKNEPGDAACKAGSVANAELIRWVDEVAAIAKPDRVHWCDGSEAERDLLMARMVEDGQFLPLNEKEYPNGFLSRSDPNDVARTEHLTFICADKKEEAGPTNNWMSPAEAETWVKPLFRGAMKGRTLYVVPYLMGPAGSPFSKVGVELTDSAYVVVNMRIMTRMGAVAMRELARLGKFVRGMHSTGDLSPDRRYILHFPARREIWSVGSGYGGNALLGKKCHSLRISSVEARDEGWLAEHMLIIGVENPAGETAYVAAAFPSACGKTNLAMMVPPEGLKGWKVWTVGDDIAWLRVGADGRLWAVNPEAGFFGIAPGTSMKTNPNAMKMVRKDSLFTNVALTADRCPWWEGFDGETPERRADWRGRLWTRGSNEKAAQPNSRFTSPLARCPSLSPSWDDPKGVPISAILFGGRRTRLVPLVTEAFDWDHGVFMGATIASETTVAQTGTVGVLRRDPMAMLPFCGYHMGDYLAHWVRMGKSIPNPPRLFRVNWFRKDASDKFLWPGFGENLRVLRWILERCAGKAAGVETPAGVVPAPGAIDVSDLPMAKGAMEELLAVRGAEWKPEADDIEKFFSTLAPRLPEVLERKRLDLLKRAGG